MLIIGTGGLGKEILGILIEDNFPGEITFYDENPDGPEKLYGTYKVLRSVDTVKKYFSKDDKRFITGIGHPRLREKLNLKTESLGGILTSVISKRTSIFHYNEKYSGVIIQPGVGISHNVIIGDGSAIHINSTIGHSSILGKYVNIGPNVSVIGPVEIGDYSYIGALSVVKPNIRIGKNVVVSVGKIVEKNLADFETL